MGEVLRRRTEAPLPAPLEARAEGGGERHDGVASSTSPIGYGAAGSTSRGRARRPIARGCGSPPRRPAAAAGAALRIQCRGTPAPHTASHPPPRRAPGRASIRRRGGRLAPFPSGAWATYYGRRRHRRRRALGWRNGRRAGLRIRCREACGFESRPEHPFVRSVGGRRRPGRARARSSTRVRPPVRRATDACRRGRPGTLLLAARLFRASPPVPGSGVATASAARPHPHTGAR